MGKKLGTHAKIGIMICAVVIVAMVVIIVLSVAMQGKEEYIESEEQSDTMSALVCKASDPVDGFFASEGSETSPENATSTFKATYVNGGLDKLFYTYEGNYDSAETAKQAEADLHARYNQFLADKAAGLTPKFVANEEEVKITLFGDWSKMTIGQAKTMGMDEEDYNALANDGKVESLTKILREKGYTCTVEK